MERRPLSGGLSGRDFEVFIRRREKAHLVVWTRIARFAGCHSVSSIPSEVQLPVSVSQQRTFRGGLRKAFGYEASKGYLTKNVVA